MPLDCHVAKRVHQLGPCETCRNQSESRYEFRSSPMPSAMGIQLPGLVCSYLGRGTQVQKIGAEDGYESALKSALRSAETPHAEIASNPRAKPKYADVG